MRIFLLSLIFFVYYFFLWKNPLLGEEYFSFYFTSYLIPLISVFFLFHLLFKKKDFLFKIAASFFLYWAATYLVLYRDRLWSYFVLYFLACFLLFLLGVILELGGKKLLDLFKVRFYFSGLGFVVSLGFMIYGGKIANFIGKLNYSLISFFILVFLFLWYEIENLERFSLRRIFSRLFIQEKRYYFWLIGFPFFLYILDKLLFPPLKTDELLYHLPTIVESFWKGKLFFFEHNVFSLYPENSIIVGNIMYALMRNGLRVFYFLPFFFLLWIVYHRFHFPKNVYGIMALLSGWLFIKKASGWGNDYFLLLFEVTALIFFLIFIEKRKYTFLVSSFYFLSLALGTKLVALKSSLFFLTVTLIYLIILDKENRIFSKLKILAVILFLLLLGCNSYIRNYFLIHSPFYPVGTKIFPTKLPYLNYIAEHQRSYFAFQGMPVSLVNFFLLPYYFLRYDFSSFFQDGLLGVWFIGLFFLLDYKKIFADRKGIFLFSFLTYYFVTWFFLGPQIERFLFFSFILLLFLEWKLPRFILPFFVFSAGFFLFFYLLVLKDIEGVKFKHLPLTLKDTGDFYTQKYPDFEAFGFLYNWFGRNKKVLGIGEYRNYLWRRKVEFFLSDVASSGVLAYHLGEKELLEFLKKNKISYIWVNTNNLTRSSFFPWWGRSIIFKSSFQKKYLRKIYSKKGIVIFKLK